MSPPLPREDLDLVLEHTRPHWEQARGAAFFITGGTGWLGRWLVESLLHASDQLGLGVSVTVLTRDSAAFLARAPHLSRPRDLGFHRGDVRTFTAPPGRFEYIIHAAADTGPVPCALHAGTLRVLDYAARQPLRGLLYLSSGAVYGDHAPMPGRTCESHPCCPTTDYGRGKADGEDLCRWYCEEQSLPCKIARCFTLIGPGMPLYAHYAAGNFIRDALAGGPLRVKGNGEPNRSWLYTADAAAWLLTILFAGCPGRAYNVGSPHAVSITGLARTVAIAAANPPLPVEIAGAPDLGPRPPSYVPDTTLAETALALQARTPLPEAIRKTLSWYR
jgi:nucleoside-diphosphate-sugar epimerase